MFNIIKYIVGIAKCLKYCVTDWHPYLQSLLLFGKKDLQKETTYVEAVTGVLRVSLKFLIFPYRLDHKKLELRPFLSIVSKLHLFFVLFIPFVKTICGIYWFLTVGSVKHTDESLKKDLIGKKMIMTYYTAIAANSIPLIYMFLKRKDVMVLLIMWPLNFEKEHQRKGQFGYVNRYFLAILILAYTSIFFMPFIQSGAGVWKPCLPMMSSSYIYTYEECKDWNEQVERNYWVVIPATMIEFYYWLELPKFYLGIAWVCLVYPGIIASKRIDMIISELKKGNESAIMEYRQIQLSRNLTNYYWKFPHMQTCLAMWLLAQILSLYAVIRLAHVLPWELYSFFALLGLDGCLLIHVHFKLLSDPCVKSHQLFEERKYMPRGGSKWFRMYMRSCSPYQLKMADGRYFDRTTALVVWQFCVDRLISFLVTK